jgi:hypothetical protein
MSRQQKNPAQIEKAIGFRFLDLITARHWAVALAEQNAGLSICQPGMYIRLGALSQREFKREMIQKLFRVMQRIDDIIIMRRYSRCFLTWRNSVIQKRSLIATAVACTDYRHQIKYIFAIWKEFTLIDKLNNKCRRHGSILLYILISNYQQRCLLRCFQKWFQWNKSMKKLVRKLFDAWSLSALKSKLHKANVLRFCKVFFSSQHRRTPRRVRWYFETWKMKSDLLGKHLLMKHFLSLSVSSSLLSLSVSLYLSLSLLYSLSLQTTHVTCRWRRSVLFFRSLSQRISEQHSWLRLRSSYLTWKKLFSIARITRLVSLPSISSALLMEPQILSSFSSYLMLFYYQRWVSYLQLRRILKRWIESHLMTVQALPAVIKPIDTSIDTESLTPFAPATPVVCVATSIPNRRSSSPLFTPSHCTVIKPADVFDVLRAMVIWVRGPKRATQHPLLP